MIQLGKIHSILLLVMLTASYFPADAQVSSQLGRFEADFDRGCAPFKIILTETDTFTTDPVIQYDFTNNGIFEGFEDGEEISYTYQNPGDYTLIQITGVDYTGVSKLDTLFVTVYPPESPEFSVFTCENHGATIEIAEDAYDQYKVFYTPGDSIVVPKGVDVPPFVYPPGEHAVTVTGLYTGGKDNCPAASKTFTTIESLTPANINSLFMVEKDPVAGALLLNYDLPPDVVYEVQAAEDFPAAFQGITYLDNPSSSIILDSINTSDNSQILRIAAYDACQGLYLYSDTLSSISIEVSAENGQNRIEWRSNPVAFAGYQLYRNGQLYQEFNNVNLSTFIDHEVECFTEYCYTIRYARDGGEISLSDTVCVESYKLYYPPSIKNTTVSVSERNIEIAWDDAENAIPIAYFIQRKVEDDVFGTIDTTLMKTYTDLDLDTDTRSFCYRINYLDECRNRSNLGDLACTVLLSIEDNQLLEWNAYTGWRSGVSRYIVEVYDEGGTLQDEIDRGLNRWYEDSTFLTRQIRLYRIRAESNDDPSLVSFSNFVIKQVESVLWVPNAFTPNGDGLNDQFRPEGTEMKAFNMQVFTRYGDLIFSTEDQNEGWDGTYNGKDMPAVTYIYRIEATDALDKQYNRTGQLLLIRQ